MPHKDLHAETRRIALLHNPRAGKGRALQVMEQIQQKLIQRKTAFESYAADWPSDLNRFSEVWLVGGDGSLNYFINVYGPVNIPMAIFKGGSGNDFAWMLYGNKSVDDYFETAFNRETKRVDLGICNGRYFLNGVGVGFDGDVVKAMGAKRFFSAGHLAYLAVVLRRILQFSEKNISLSWPLYQRTESLFMVNVANGSRYGGGFMVAPEASLTDGLLDLIIVKPIGKFKRFFYLPKIEKGTHLGLPFVESFHCTRIMISSEQLLTGHLDGELMESRSFQIEVLPGKLEICC